MWNPKKIIYCLFFKKKATRKEFECFHHKQMENTCGDRYDYLVLHHTIYMYV
jgi:hypothetical protein